MKTKFLFSLEMEFSFENFLTFYLSFILFSKLFQKYSSKV